MAQLFYLAAPHLGIRNRHRRTPIPPRQGVLEIRCGESPPIFRFVPPSDRRSGA